MRESGGKVYAWTNAVPFAALADPALAQRLIASAVKLAKKYGFDGFSIDDESDCAPRSTLVNFTKWVHFVDTFADALHAEGMELSAAVQAMFGIQDVSYRPLCHPPENPGCSQACNKVPS